LFSAIVSLVHTSILEICIDSAAYFSYIGGHLFGDIGTESSGNAMTAPFNFENMIVLESKDFWCHPGQI
jgi:hypothetical protein